MISKARASGLTLRPHCKTHQSHKIASWFLDFGISKITVSSVDMAAYFAQAGWRDILIAFPFNPLEINRLNELTKICRMSVLADHPETIAALQTLDGRVGLYIDIDPGYGRTGIPSGEYQQIEDLIRASRQNPKLDFSGFYCHAGHSYKARDQAERDQIHRCALSDLSGLKRHFSAYHPRILYGDTPNCSIQKDFHGLDEITPGNFVFYDLTQATIGSCRESDIALAMACPVVGKHIGSQEMVIHGGAVHFSKESLESDGQLIYGKGVHFSKAGWSPLRQASCITSLSQEHGVVAVTENVMADTRIGDLLVFHPVHSCLTANLMKQYTTLDGQVITMQ